MPTEPTDQDRRHELPPKRPPSSTDVAVVGAGLAGLVAAITAARAGAGVLLCDAGSVGGRARVSVIEPGVTFNMGPRAMYRGGAAARELAALGVRWTGASPPARGGRLWQDGRLHRMPGTAGELLGTAALTARSKLRVGLLLGTIGRVRADEHAGTSVSQWIDGLRLAPDAAGLLHAVVRLATYVDRPDELDAAAAITQVQLALGDGVEYLDGGWAVLVDQLVDLASAAGVQVVSHTRVRTVGPAPADGAVGRGPWCVELADSTTVHAGAVVLASGTPAAAQGLSAAPLHTRGVGEPVTAACWELAVRGEVPVGFLLGVDRPCYLSRHSPPARLAPEGIQVVHALRYGARDAAADRQELELLAAAAGIEQDHLVAERFLHRMVVSGGTPTAAAGGTAGRPAVRVPGVDGLYLAGDWVGDEGLLADAAVASGVQAGGAAAAGVTAGAQRAATAPAASG